MAEKRTVWYAATATLLGAATGTLLGFGASAHSQPPAAERATLTVTMPGHPGIATYYPPCPTEDSVECYWDAATRGNGEGLSYIALADGAVYYLVP